MSRYAGRLPWTIFAGGTSPRIHKLRVTDIAPGPHQMATWIGTASDPNNANYNSPSNWTGGDTPDAPGETATFGATGTQRISLSAPVNPDSWIFSPTAQSHPFLITGATVTLNSGLIDNSTGAGQSIDVSIAGTGSVQMNGIGTLSLGGQNTYTGGTFINTGTLQVSGSIVGDIVNNGTLLLSRSDTTIFGSKISGTGNVFIDDAI